MPETTSYLILGLIVSLGTMALYGASLWLRYTSATKDSVLIEQLLQDES